MQMSQDPRSIIELEVHYDKGGEVQQNAKTESGCFEGGNLSDKIVTESLPLLSEERNRFPEVHVTSQQVASRIVDRSTFRSGSRRELLQLKLEAARKKAALEEKLEEEERKAERKSRERRYLREKRLIEMELEMKLSTAGSYKTRIPKDTVNNLQKVKGWLADSESEQEKLEKCSNNFNKPDSSIDRTYNTKSHELNECDGSSKIIVQYPNDEEHEYANSNAVLEKKIARQTIRELPFFNGDPEEWPIFIFTRSACSCQFTDEGNLLRLQKCLRGRARDIIESIMNSSSDLEIIIKTLKLNSGNPDLINSILIERARKVISCSKARTDYTILFSNAVLNLTSTIGALDTKQHMDNGPLCKTSLGWTVHSIMQANTRNHDKFLIRIPEKVENEELYNVDKELFSMKSFEERVEEKETKTKEELPCDKIVKQATKRNGFRIKTGLSRRIDDIQVADNRQNAQSSSFCMENKGDTNENLTEAYSIKVEEYLVKGYAKKRQKEEIADGKLHFPVFDENEKKLMVIMSDIVSKTKTLTFDTELLQELNLPELLTEIPVTFCQQQTAFTRNRRRISQQIFLRKKDRTLHKPHWRWQERKNDFEINEITQKFWMPTLRNSVKKIWKICQFYKNNKPQLIVPKLRPISEERLIAFCKSIKYIAFGKKLPTHFLDEKMNEY